MKHRWTLEHREQSKRSPLGVVDVWQQHRYVCSCGVTTRWNRYIARALRERDRHAIDGQLSHDT